MTTTIQKIISGGQTGADRAALDAAIESGVPIGGWVPKGRLAEDGPVDPTRYPGLIETDRSDYFQRTELNVRDSDATLIISHGSLTGGSAYTRDHAQKIHKPWIHVDLNLQSLPEAIPHVQAWLAPRIVKTLNVAGPRASGDPMIYDPVKQLIVALLSSRSG